jgi:hypothetical protein
MRTPLQALYNFFHPGPSAEEVDCLHKDLRLKVHENRNVAQRALGSMPRTNRLKQRKAQFSFLRAQGT